ncbi:MAG: hypothetical protein IKW57_03585 [Alphaproteobacteria bacterium]|nr:hypothetical protein [Alphaproteobacteria bacterium]
MKKIIWISGLVGLAGNAFAANVINGGPFDGPQEGGFYNLWTPIQANSKFERFVMKDDLEYGISDAFSIRVATSGSYDSSDNPEYGKWSWNDLLFGFDWTLWQQGELISEIYGDVKQIYDTKHNLQTVAYNWTMGARVGRMTDNWTVAGIVQVDYRNDDLPHDTFDAWAMTVGILGQYIVSNKWNWVAGLMFDFDLFDDYYNGERLRLKVGLNRNLDENKYLGVYAEKDIVHSFESAPAVIGVAFGVVF